MFFRLTRTRTNPVLQLVEAFRDSEGRPRQRILLSLGGQAVPKELWKPVVAELKLRLRGEKNLFECPKDVEEWVERILPELERTDIEFKRTSRTQSDQDVAPIYINKITHRNTTMLGPVLAALQAWNALGFSDLLITQLGFRPVEVRDVAISTINRLIDPCSENALPAWVKTTSLEDLWGEPFRKLSEDRFYRISDRLLEHKDQIETALSKREESLFDLKRTIYLYDVTNTYLEGSGQKNPKAKRGASKEKRFDCPLVSLGMVLDSEGFVIQHQTFSGNTHDGMTLLPMVQQLDARASNSDNREPPLVIVDSGMASERNLAQLRREGFDYIVVGKRPTRLAFDEEFATLSFSEIADREGKSAVRVAMKEEENETIVFCQSDLRGEKEKSILSNAEERFLKDLRKLQGSIQRGKFKRLEVIQRKIGRLQERHPRAARYYDVDLATSSEGQHQLHWQRVEEKYEQAQDLLGCYYLRCSRKGMTPNEIWHLYMMLTRVEAGFRVLKSDLGLRPVYHHREDRCDGHIFITVLAYRLLHWIEHSLRKKGDVRSWPTIRRVLQTHAYTTIVCPAADDRVLTVRSAGEPDSEQRAIYDILGVNYRQLPRTQLVA